MDVNEYFMGLYDKRIKDKHDLKIQQFDAHDMMEFAECYHQKKMEQEFVIVLKKTRDMADLLKTHKVISVDEYQELIKDKKRLDKLQSLTKGHGNGWVLRDSSTGRGMRLHETELEDATPNVREAIDNYKIYEL